MTVYCCPRCEKRELFSTGAFWLCAGCEYVITSVALSKEGGFRRDSAERITLSAESPVAMKGVSIGEWSVMLKIMILVAGFMLGWLSWMLAPGEAPARLHQHGPGGQEPVRYEVGAFRCGACPEGFQAWHEGFAVVMSSGATVGGTVPLDVSGGAS